MLVPTYQIVQCHNPADSMKAYPLLDVVIKNVMNLYDSY
jgi:hypothetical protein